MQVKGKVKDVFAHGMKTYRGSGGVASRIINLGITWIWMVSVMLRLFYPRRKSLLCQVKRRLAAPQNGSGHFGVEINDLPLAGFEPWTTQLVVWPVEASKKRGGFTGRNIENVVFRTDPEVSIRRA